jgi:putative serine protease PepD
VPAPPAPSRGGPGLGIFILVAVLVAFVAGAVGAGITAITTASGSKTNLGGSSGAASSTVKSRPPDSVAGVAQRVLPSVVTIKVSLGNGAGGTGTGFVVNNGYIVTNNHVVADAASGAQMQVVFNDKKTTTATIVGRDPSSDVAVIKPATINGLQPLTLGNSDDIAVGDPVIAIGSPLGLQGSVTTGIVSALNRPVGTSGESGGDAAVLNAIQTDAAINPGNSGGPLVDAQGRVIGVNTAIATLGAGMGGGAGGGQSGSIGVGFAIPVNQVKRVAEEIINSGGKTPQHAIIGIIMDPTYQGNGVRVAPTSIQGKAAVTPGGPADKAGMKPGDVITGFDGKPVGDATDLLALIRSRTPGEKVKITFTRGGKETTADLTLGATN